MINFLEEAIKEYLCSLGVLQKTLMIEEKKKKDELGFIKIKNYYQK